MKGFRTSSEEQCDLLLKMSTGASIGKKDDLFCQRRLFPKTTSGGWVFSQDDSVSQKKTIQEKDSGPDSWKSVKDG